MAIEDYLTSIGILTISVVFVIVTNYLFKKKSIFSKDKVTKHIILLFIIILGLIISIFTLPISTDTKQLILSVIGIAAGATVTFSSTTFIANAASGIMLKIVKPFKIGDYISTNHEFGKVSEIQTLHTQVQSIDRDLITIPNRKLVSETVKTISSTGTIISTTLSLGYDIPRDRIENDLIYAAEKIGLENPFVHVIELGNFAITYKVGGFLGNIENLITTRSNFKKTVIDTLHDDNVEIVSPTYMNQRVYGEEHVCIPPKRFVETVSEVSEKTTEDIMFDKAIEAEKLNNIEINLGNINEKKKQIDGKLSSLVILPLYNHISEDNFKHRIKNEMELITRDQEEIKNNLDDINEKPEITDETDENEKSQRLKTIEELDETVNRLYDRLENIEKKIDRISEPEK